MGITEKVSPFQELLANVQGGIVKKECKSWLSFSYFINKSKNFRSFLWRGQRKEDWELIPTLDRAVQSKKFNAQQYKNLYGAHLDNFKQFIKGHRSQYRENYGDSVNEWWALGQHFGLHTPLLDWTYSPYVAAYFAFQKPKEKDDQNKMRVIWALNPRVLSIGTAKKDEFPDLESLIFRPQQEDNPRLINQSGLFTLTQPGISLEEYAKKVWKEIIDPQQMNELPLIRFEIPESSRLTCLRRLNMMNINHMTLFPDLTGVSEYCNHGLKISDYLPPLRDAQFAFTKSS